MNEAARVRWDEGRREPRSGTGRETSDPLAELARLVGQDDPYRKVFRPEPPAREEDWRDYDGEGQGHDASSPEAAYPAHDDPAVHPGLAGDWHTAAEPTHAAAHAEPGAWDGDGEGYAHADGYAEDDGYAHAEAHHHADDEHYYAAEAAAHRDDAGLPEAAAAQSSIPDLWAAGQGGAAPEVSPDVASGRARESGTARRPLLVLAAVLVLTGGGLAASFLAKGGSSGTTVAAANGNGAPTILAATGPTKVKQEDPSATAPEDKDAALLSKGVATVAGPAKVVQSEEQPTDLSQLPNAEPGTAQAAAPGPFPEAKKVRTFVVHPDGTPIYDDGQSVGATAAPAPAPQAPSAGATPRATGVGVATPPSPTIASLAADPAPPVVDATPAPAPAATPAPVAPKRDSKPKPAPAARTGSFGLQLAASPSEAEANAAFAKLKRKYPSELGSLVASVHQSDTGGKPVYRVRVGGMSREEAGALCSKLMAGGGSCFVVHD